MGADIREGGIRWVLKLETEDKVFSDTRKGAIFGC